MCIHYSGTRVLSETWTLARLKKKNKQKNNLELGKKTQWQ